MPNLTLGILKYKSTAICIAEDADGPTGFIPVQSVLMAESFIPKPGMSNLNLALCLWKLDEMLRNLASAVQHSEIYMFTAEEDYADKIQKHGWVEVKNVRLFKKKVVQKENNNDSHD